MFESEKTEPVSESARIKIMSHPILIMGATSGIGLEATRLASETGIPIRAFARSANTLPAMPHVEPCPGDARNADDVARALEGVGAVIFALGIRERVAMLWEEETLFSDATRVLLEAMPNAGVSRLIAVTGFGAGRSRAAMSRIEAMGHRALLGRPYADKDRQEALLIESDLDWTIARPVILSKGPRTGTYRVLSNPTHWRNGLISRKDVADYLLKAVTEGLNLREDVVLTR